MSEQPTARRRATSVVATSGVDAPANASDTLSDTLSDTVSDGEHDAVTAAAPADAPDDATDALDTIVEETPDVSPTNGHASAPSVTDGDVDAEAAVESTVGTTESTRAAATPIVRRRPRVRRVTRVVRHVDTWTVFKVALVFHLVLYVSALVSGVLLWNVAHGTGTVDNVERFMESFGWETFSFDGQQMFDAAWRIGLFLVVGLTGLAVLAATTFNLITDIVGGVRVTVLEEEVLAVPRASVARPAAGAGRRAGRRRSG